jgi:membrane protein
MKTSKPPADAPGCGFPSKQGLEAPVAVRWTRRAYEFAKGVVQGFLDHDAMSLAAAVAFYTALSFAPLVLLLVTFGGLMGDSTRVDLVQFFNQQIGPRAAEVTQAIVENEKSKSYATLSWRSLIGIALLFVSVSGVFGQVQLSLNRIWEVPEKEKPKKKSGIFQWIRKRLLSMGMVLAMLFILLVTLILSAIIERIVPHGDKILGRITVTGASFAVAAILFALIFRILPDRAISWRQVWFGALITALLFSVGKLLIGLYLERGGVGEDYGGAAGAMIALLVWVYYSCLILFFGAEITRQSAGPVPPPVSMKVATKEQEPPDALFRQPPAATTGH